MSRINCHSAFKHYEMFHGNKACCGGNSYGSVFNTTYNINCGGHNGGFWGGFGMGLGAMVGNWFSGIAGNFGFGGFGGGMGFGFPSFGGGYGNFGNFGNWGGANNSNTRTENNKTTVETKEVIKNDPDCTKIADITGKIKNLDANATKKDVQDIIDDIDNAIENLDNNNKPAQTRTLENLKVQMQEKLSTLDNAPAGNTATPNGSAQAAAPVAQQPATVGATNGQAAPADTTAADTITVGGKPVKIADLASVDALKGMTDAELAAVTKPQAEAALEKLGYITTYADGNKVGHLSNVYAVLKLLEKSGVTVEVETRAASSDQWIKGPISNVAKDSEGKLSYNVNCSGIAGATLEGEYTFQAQEKENKTYKCSTKTSGIKVADIEVNYQDEKQPLINKSAQALAKQA